MKPMKPLNPDTEKVFTSLVEPLEYLHCRWLDERDYEDFTNYAHAMRHHLSEACPEAEFLRATKSPFGLCFRHVGKEWQMKLSSRGATIVEIPAK